MNSLIRKSDPVIGRKKRPILIHQYNQNRTKKNPGDGAGVFLDFINPGTAAVFYFGNCAAT